MGLFASFFEDAPSGLGAVIHIGGNAALLDKKEDLFPVVLLSALFGSAQKGEGAAFDIGGNTLPEEGLVEKGLIGVAVDMGGNAALLGAVGCSVVLLSSFAEGTPNGLNATADTGGNC